MTRSLTPERTGKKIARALRKHHRNHPERVIDIVERFKRSHQERVLSKQNRARTALHSAALEVIALENSPGFQCSVNSVIAWASTHEESHLSWYLNQWRYRRETMSNGQPHNWSQENVMALVMREVDRLTIKLE